MKLKHFVGGDDYSEWRDIYVLEEKITSCWVPDSYSFVNEDGDVEIFNGIACVCDGVSYTFKNEDKLQKFLMKKFNIEL